MMKTALLLLAAPLMAFGFAPSTMSSRVPTKMNQLYNPSDMYNRAEEADASRIVFEECSVEECVTAEAEKDYNGEWQQSMHANGETVSRNILMMEVDSTE